jgi:hypothetical protein
MSFRAAISISQDEVGQAKIVDISDYSVEHHSAFLSRELFLYKKDGALLSVSPQFSFANYPSDEILISLKKDYCLKVVMVLTPIVALQGSKYSITEIYNFDYYSKEYMVQMGLSICRNPSVRSDANFYGLMQQYYVNTKFADLSADNLQQAASQFWLDRMGNTSAVVQASDGSELIIAPTQDAIIIPPYTFEATGNEGTSFSLPVLIGKEIIWFFRDDPKPLRRVGANPIAGQFKFTSSTGGFVTGVELQAGEFIQIQYTNQ